MALHVARARASGSAIRVLDYGCGAGGFMEFARMRSQKEESLRNIFEIHGFDIGSYANRLVAEKKFRILDERGIAGCSGMYDVITCVEVIEHSRDVNLTMGNLSRLLKPGGLLVLTTGNLNCPAARLSGPDYRYIIPDIHISLFNPDCLSLLYNKHGLSPVRVRYNGVLKYKVMTSIRSQGLKRFASAMLRVPGALSIIDLIYGVSAMPCAIKPMAELCL